MSRAAGRPLAAVACSWRRARPWLALALVPWLVARAVVVGTLAMARVVASRAHVDAAAAFRVHQGLLGWDAGWYEFIAAHGYRGAGYQSLRFWPLLPALGRVLAVLPGVSPGTGVLVVANVTSLLGIALVARLTALETEDMASARRAAWLMAIAPPAFVYVMGYAEGLLLLATAGAFLALRRQAWWWAALCGLAASLTRPLGLALVAPALVEAGRTWWEPWWVARRRRHPSSAAGSGMRWPRRRERLVARVAAIVAPVGGTLAYLGWVQWRFHDFLAPVEIQEQSDRHGALADPLVTMAHDLITLVHGHHLDQGLHVPWVALVVVLVVVALRRLPVSYGLFAAAIVAVAVSGTNLDSFERYALSAFPVVVVGAMLTRSPRVERVVMAGAVAGLVAYGLLAFLNILVP
ncbi:MAG: hypothetical protein M0Z82_17575 [Actinomycetota bacterium]|jgi:hypothetical protein|nr:hypothetical protein [Actinomycetota bacterium]